MFRIPSFAAALVVASTAGALAESPRPVTIVLNWVPGGDHAPIYWAHATGRYRAAGLEVSIETGRGSGFSVQRVGAGAVPFGIADLATALQGRSRGADVVAAMAIYAQSPYGIYWKKSSGIRDVKDLKGKKIGAPPADAARQMWPAIARAVGLKPNDVTWVNVAPEAKVASLQSGAVHATTHFFNVHYVYERVFGADMGFVALRDVGFNPYGNAIIVNGDFLRGNPKVVEAFVRATQKAYADCVVNPQPCNSELGRAASQPMAEVDANWRLVEILMSNETTRKIALGWFDPQRVAKDAAMVQEVFKTPPIKPTDAYTNAFLDKSVKMPK